jgi:glycosyltransferase involved in cell wall biosynthesis
MNTDISTRESNNSKPSISLIIPTRERCETLKYTLQTAIQQDTPDYEIIVCDNNSTDDTASVVREVSDPRIRYVNPGRRLSMCDNWDFALAHAAGQYVIFIGDDDAVTKHGIDRLKALLRERPYEAYMWTTPTYTWPIDDHEPMAEGHLSTGVPHELDLRDMARTAIANGGWRHYRIPGTYHAAISKRILDAIRDRSGRVFHTTQPDLFTSLAVPAYASTSLYTGYPITILGWSGKSNGGASIAKDGRSVQAKCIAEYGDYKTHRTLFPDTPIAANLICDAFLVAKDMFPELYGDVPFNYEAMWAYMCRLRLVSRWTVLSKRKAIRSYHRLRTARFLASLAVQDVSALRRIALDALKRKPRVGAPRNILQFAEHLHVGTDR